MNDAEYHAAEERLSKVSLPGVYQLWQHSGRLVLDGEFSAAEIEQILNALRGTRERGAK